MTRQLLLLVGGVLWLAACASNEGALEQATFSYDCEASQGGCKVRPLQEPIVKGGRVNLSIAMQPVAGSTAPPTHLRSGNPDVFSVGALDLQGVRPGVATLMLLSPDDIVLDFYHVWVGEPSHLRVLQIDGTGADTRELRDGVEVPVNTGLTAVVRSYAQAQPMLGNFDVEWRAEPPTVLVRQDTVEGRYILTPQQPGEVTVSVTGLTLTETFTLVVTP